MKKRKKVSSRLDCEIVQQVVAQFPSGPPIQVSPSDLAFRHQISHEYLLPLGPEPSGIIPSFCGYTTKSSHSKEIVSLLRQTISRYLPPKDLALENFSPADNRVP